jgi:HEAT repeat protein
MNSRPIAQPLTRDVDAPSESDVALVEDLLRALSTALRSHRLYGGNGPMLERFVGALHQKLQSLWRVLPELRLEIGERRMWWEGRVVYPTGDASGDLPFLFYRDGIRELVFLPGFEGEELERFLNTVATASQLQRTEDDLVTLLWERSFSLLRYRTVDISLEEGGMELPHAPDGTPEPVNAQAMREEVGGEQVSQGLSADDFKETLHFLDEADLRRLVEEVEREDTRDLWADLLAALLDRLEDGTLDRQVRIVRILTELLPSLLAVRQFSHASALFGEMVEIASRDGVLGPAVLRELRTFFAQLADASTLEQLVDAVSESVGEGDKESVVDLFGYLPPEALAPLLRIGESVSRSDVRRLLSQATGRLATAHPQVVVGLLRGADPAVVAGALHWVAALGVGGIDGEVVRLLESPEPRVRMAAIGALLELGAVSAADALIKALEDPEREVRIAAANGLGAFSIPAAREGLEAALTSKRLRVADQSEKVVFFEAYGRVAGEQAVAFLNRIINARSWLGRGESPEMRACAALALAQIRHPDARAALAAAAKDKDPVVRSAVARALRQHTT